MCRVDMPCHKPFHTTQPLYYGPRNTSFAIGCSSCPFTLNLMVRVDNRTFMLNNVAIWSHVCKFHEILAVFVPFTSENVRPSLRFFTQDDCLA